MDLLQYSGYVIAIWAICEVSIFLLTHFMVRSGRSVVLAKLVAVIGVAGLLWLVLAFLATPARAESLVTVARCTIDANNRLPAGAELEAAERRCYNLLGKHGDALYHARHPRDDQVIMERHANWLWAVQRGRTYYPIEPSANALPAARYTSPYGAAPAYPYPYGHRSGLHR
jgi:hypothetical protein